MDTLPRGFIFGLFPVLLLTSLPGSVVLCLVPLVLTAKIAISVTSVFVTCLYLLDLWDCSR